METTKKNKTDIKEAVSAIEDANVKYRNSDQKWADLLMNTPIYVQEPVFEGMALLDSAGNICSLTREENGFRAVPVTDELTQQSSRVMDLMRSRRIHALESENAELRDLLRWCRSEANFAHCDDTAIARIDELVKENVTTIKENT